MPCLTCRPIRYGAGCTRVFISALYHLSGGTNEPYKGLRRQHFCSVIWTNMVEGTLEN